MGPPVKGVNLVFLWVISIFLVSRLISASVSEGSWLLCVRWRGVVEGVLLLRLPVCLQSRFQQCQHMLAPTGVLLCCCLTEYAGCCVAAGCEGRWGHLSETEEQIGSQTANNILLVAVFLNQEFCVSFQGVYFCSVVGARVTSWDGEGGGCSI